MTAIAAFYTSRGFVVAADGRRTDDSGVVITDESQKIFQFNHGKDPLTFSMTGLSGDGEQFDISTEAIKHTADLSDKEFNSLAEYTEELAGHLNDSYKRSRDQDLIALPTHEIAPQYGAWQIGAMVIAGYFNGQPSWTVTDFFHYDQVNSRFHVNALPVKPGRRLFFGSDKITALLYPQGGNPDPRLAKYANDSAGADSLEVSAEIAKKYIEAHCDEAALQEHYDFCRQVGGHIHIAEITPAGFRWRIPPKEKDDSTAVESPQV